MGAFYKQAKMKFINCLLRWPLTRALRLLGEDIITIMKRASRTFRLMTQSRERKEVALERELRGQEKGGEEDKEVVLSF